MADTEQQLKMVKSMLRATLISSKEGISADTLLRDYEELTGETLPFKSLGFSSLKEFIQSIPDVVEVIRNEVGRTFLFAVSCESNKHILDLVQRQKSGGCKKFKEARKPFPKTEYIESKCGSNKHDQQHATSRKPLLKFPLIPTQRRSVFDRLGPRPKVQENNYVGLSKSANMPCQNSTDVQINIARTLSGRGCGRKVKEASKPLSKTEDTEAGCRSTKPDRQHTTSRKPLLESSIIQTQRTAVFQTLGTKPKVLDHDHVGLSRSANVPYQNITGASRTPSVRGCGRRVKLNI